jgi:hypothetical protein
MPRQVHGSYQGLTRGPIYNWFIANGEIMDGVKRFVKVGTYFTKNSQHTPILEGYLHITVEIVKDLQDYRKTGFSLSILLVQPIINVIFRREYHICYSPHLEGHLKFQRHEQESLSRDI